jgi:FtsH-binding integral membrane protein
MRSVRTTLRQAIDSGLHTYLLRVYRYMGLGLAVTGVLAYLLSGVRPQTLGILPTIATFSLLGISIYFSAAFNRMSASTAQGLFWVFSALMGLSLTGIFGFYRASSIASAFFVTACTFGVMTVYAQNTKRDLTGIGSFCRMGLWGIIIAGFVNIFLKNSMVDFITSLIGVGVFTGLIAYQTQNLRQMYYALPNDEEIRQKMAIAGALNLYMSVINLFLSLLRLMGDRK